MFDTKAIEKIGYYVYALFDPEDMSSPFYIGKGSGNRVFLHSKGIEPPDLNTTQMPAKLEKIVEIKHRNQEVKSMILRYALSEDEAFAVEAALIDMMNFIAPDSLTNQVSGKGVAEGIIDVIDLEVNLQAEQFETDEPVLIIKIEDLWSKLLNQYGSACDVPRDDIYEATRASWVINERRAMRASCILSVARGLIREVFVADRWFQCEDSNRKYFEGRVDENHRDFIGQSVAYMFKKGGQNPIRYHNC